MNWFRVAVGMSRHPKTYALAAELGVPVTQAAGMLLGILEWAATLDQEDIVLPSNQAAGIMADQARFVGMPGILRDALIRTGWLDRIDENTVRLHDWAQWNGPALRASLTAKGRMQKLRESRHPHAKSSANVTRTVRRTFASTHTHEQIEALVDSPTASSVSNVVALTNAEESSRKGVPLIGRAAEGPADKRRDRRDKRLTKNGDGQTAKDESPQAKLVAAWMAVYLAQTGERYVYQPADFVMGAMLARQGVTPEEVTKASERAFRPGIKEWHAVRSFKALAAKFSEVKVARSDSSAHNVATDAEFAADADRFNKTPF